MRGCFEARDVRGDKIGEGYVWSDGRVTYRRVVNGVLSEQEEFARFVLLLRQIQARGGTMPFLSLIPPQDA